MQRGAWEREIDRSDVEWGVRDEEYGCVKGVIPVNGEDGLSAIWVDIEQAADEPIQVPGDEEPPIYYPKFVLGEPTEEKGATLYYKNLST